MKVLINLKNFFKYFLVIFFVSCLFYLIRMFGSYNIISEGNVFDYLVLFIKLSSDWVVLFSILSSVLAILLISTGLKLKGGFSVVFTILIISLLCLTYPIAMKYLNHEKASSFLLGYDIESYSDVLDKDLIYNKNGSFIHMEDALDYEYKDIMILDDYKILTSGYGYGTATNITLIDVDVVNLKNNTQASYVDYDYKLHVDLRENSARILDTLFAMPLIDYFGHLFLFFMNSDVPIYVLVIVYLSLAITFMGFYTLGGALTANFMRFQNMAIAFLVYIVFILLVYFVSSFIDSKMPIEAILQSTGILWVSILMLISSFIINVFALLVHYIFRFDKYYK